MWTDETRVRHDRSGLRDTHDLTDAEWTEVEPLIPPARRGGNKRTVNIRKVENGIMEILGSGYQWRDIPKDLPPRSTVHDYLDLWSDDGTLENIHHALYIKCRELEGREASPNAGAIDSQSLKSAEKGGSHRSDGYDAGKKIKGKKRHVLVDTTGLLMHAIVHPADIQDRDGGATVMATLFGLYTFLSKLYADGGYQGPIFREAADIAIAKLNVEIAKRSDQAKSFDVLPKR